MIPRDYRKTGWVELHSIRNKFMVNKMQRILLSRPVDDIDAQIRIVDRHIRDFNKPPYWKRTSKP